MNITKFQEDLCNELKLKNYSSNTIKSYCGCISVYLNYFKHKVDPIHISEQEIKQYLLTLSSTAYVKQMIGSLILFYRCVIKQPRKLNNIEYPRKEFHIPKVLDEQFILQKLDSIPNIKHKAILSLAFSVGLRVSEICNLKLMNIDSKSEIKTIKIVQGKGMKDRIVPLTDKLKNLLTTYYQTHKPKIFLFEGQTKGKYSTRSCEQIYHKYIDTNSSFHCLRHSCATALLNKGTDLRFIQELLGHNSSRTTERYTHVSKKSLSQIPLPI